MRVVSSLLGAMTIACLPQPLPEEEESSGGATSTSDAECEAWHPDDDRDGFGDRDRAMRTCSPPPGWVLDAADCYDENADANPSQTEFFALDRGDGSYDYDCDGDVTEEISDIGSCNPEHLCADERGWDTGIAVCGRVEKYWVECDGPPVGVQQCAGVSEGRLQRCR